jgi:DNA-binding NtrC family response regulator
VLEERKVVRVGSMQPISVPARVIAATHRDLEADVASGRFRQDLLFRLAVHVLRVPPLRERLSDLPELVDVIIAATCERFGMRRKTIAAEALELLAAYDWKRNNVRELRNIVERMLIAADGDRIGAEHVPAEIIEGSPHAASSIEARTFVERKAEAERQIIVAALEQNEWHITRTAQSLGLADHASLLKIMRRHGISSR